MACTNSGTTCSFLQFRTITPCEGFSCVREELILFLLLWTQVQSLFGELLIAALELISSCNCTGSAGCPNCIQVRVMLNPNLVGRWYLRSDAYFLFFQSLTCSEYNEVLDREAAILIMKVNKMLYACWIYILRLQSHCSRRNVAWLSGVPLLV
jgi:hypothetical protein